MDNRRTIIEANLSFGLINMLVSVTKAQGRNNVRLRNVHETCGTPISQRNLCPTCNVMVEEHDLAKGFQVNRHKLVQLDPDELEQFTAGRSRTIELRKFVGRKQIDQLLVEKLYYLAPNEALRKPYDLLAATLGKSKTVAVGKASLWGRETPVAVWPEQNSLTLALLYCADEVLPPIDLTKPSVGGDELDMSLAYVRLMMDKFGDTLTPDDLTSESRTRTMEYIESVIAGVHPAAAATASEPEPTVNLMAMLKEMVK